MKVENYSLKMPKAVFGGVNSLEKIPQILAEAGAKHVAVFTDKSIKGAGLFTLIEEQVINSGLGYEVYDDLPAEPSYMQVQENIERFKKTTADFIIACGGGSVIDSAKLASILLTDEYGVKELLDEPTRAKKCAKILAVPTTAGTGAECTPNAIVGVPEKAVKIGIVNLNMIPDYVILDAKLIEHLPRKIAASTGIDAMCHAIECYTSNKANPFSNTFALEAFDLIMNNIEKACDDSTAMEEKNRMQIAAFYGGVAITASGTTAVHALSYPLGGKYHIAHGVSNAMLLIPVMKYNYQDPQFQKRLAVAWDKAYHGDKKFEGSEQKAHALIEWMSSIVKHLDIPGDLKEFGVDPKDLDELVTAGMAQQRLLVNNMRTLTDSDAKKIYLEII